MIFCNKCGTAVQGGGAFCHSCGMPVSLNDGQSEEKQPEAGEAFKTQIRNKPVYGLVNLEDLPMDHIIDDRYKVSEKLGQGGFGAVYRVYDKKMKIDKALKVLPTAVVNDREAMENLGEEASTMVRLNSPNIVRVYDFQEKGEIKYIDMEFVDGKSLSDVKLDARGKKLSEGNVIKLANQIADGLFYAHSKNVIHRDIKPQNILLSKTGKIKIMDFGISETVRGSMSRIENSVSSGTLVYMSPEQIKGRNVGREADIYSFGVMLYELLSGMPPFAKGDISYQIINEKPAPIKDVSESMNRFLDKCLAKDYQARFRDFLKVKKALNNLTVSKLPGIKKAELSGIITSEETPSISTLLNQKKALSTAVGKPDNLEIGDLNLSMQNKDKLEKLTCPKCNTFYTKNVLECRNCGIIFEKLKNTTPNTPVKVSVAMKPDTTKQEKPPIQALTSFLPLIIVVAVLAIGSAVIYFSFIESWVDTGHFEKSLTEFTTFKIEDVHENVVSPNENPFRTGKVLIVIPAKSITMESVTTGRPVTVNQPALVHPTWYKLKRNLRARYPDDVDTLIRVDKELGESGRYGTFKSKVYNTNKIILKVYDWRNKTYIGTKIFDPVKGNSFLADEDYESLSKLNSDDTIAEFIQSMAFNE